MVLNRLLKVLMLAVEVVPFAKVGGLADVVGSLPKALKALGHDVRVAMPRYGHIAIERFGLTEVLDPFPVPISDGPEPAAVLQGAIGDDTADVSVPVYMIDSAKYYEGGVYTGPDDAERFIFFCRATVEMLRHLSWQPDILHCHDWHTAIVPNWMKTIYADDPFFAHTATVYTIHNLAYQGICAAELLQFAGLDDTPLLEVEGKEAINLMARGILFADIINTVSERYAQEILTPDYGVGLDPLLAQRRDRLFGVLNGIDYKFWNPATDPHIVTNFDLASLDRRVENKLALQREAGLPVSAEVPLIGMISRLADQKGFDILAEAFDSLLELDLQFVLLGMGEKHYHELFAKVAEDYPGQAAVFLRFDPALARRIYAGSDIFLMPSRFEPSGLGQMIAMRYGSVPVVRSTGGLADTVRDFDPATGEGNGFAFEPYDAEALYAALGRALDTYKDKAIWRRLQVRGMSADFSWDASAKKYVDLYHQALDALAHAGVLSKVSTYAVEGQNAD